MEKNTNEMDFVFFWQAGDISYKPYCCFSQWQYSEFREEELASIQNLTCAEQYMMASKAWIFGDEETKQEILEACEPKQMKSLGRKVRNFDLEIWEKTRHSIVLNGNYHKFAQNKAMRDILLGTGDKILAEASPTDTIWGIGLGENNSKATGPSSWRGLNLLGFALMEVRDEIRRVYQNYGKVDWTQFESQRE
ncbi:MAG: NADAR family protein [Eubacteriaceae bacterium]|nr:NADAR family protein [Eubacteriaceae bacterium]